MNRLILTLGFLAIVFNSISQDTASPQIKADWVDPASLFTQPKQKVDSVDRGVLLSLEADKSFLKKLPESYEQMSPAAMKSFAKQIESKLQQLIREKEELIKSNASQEVVEQKTSSINTLSKEKKIVDLSVKTGELTEENKIYERWLFWAIITAAALMVIVVLTLIALRQRNRISKQNQKIVDQYDAIQLKGSYLEYAARLIRHDLHSGINTYIPRGLNSLERRLPAEAIKNMELEGSLRMIKDGLSHTQRVYRRVHDFTSMVKENATIEKFETHVDQVLAEFLKTTAYQSQVQLGESLPTLMINSTLFCTAIDNLIRNGLKYNDSDQKMVKIYHSGEYIVVEDNGRGMSQAEFENFCKPQSRQEQRSDAGEGLGLSISLAIFADHGFSVTAERNETVGTKLKIKIDNV